MFNRSKALLVTGLSLLGALGMRAPRAESYPERRERRGKPITSRFFWGGRRWRVPLGGGVQEVERRRQQIEAGTLLTTEGQKRLRDLRAGRPVVLGADYGGPDGDCTVKGIVDEKGHVQVTDVEYTHQGAPQP